METIGKLTKLLHRILPAPLPPQGLGFRVFGELQNLKHRNPEGPYTLLLWN